MTEQQTDHRDILVLQNRSVEDSTAIADILARRLVLEIYNSEGRLMRLEGGALQAITNPILMDIIRQHIVTTRLVDRDGVWTPELTALSFERQQLVDITNKLLLIIARAPGAVREIGAQKISEIKHRKGIGEPIEALARYYGLSTAEVREVAARP